MIKVIRCFKNKPYTFYFVKEEYLKAADQAGNFYSSLGYASVVITENSLIKNRLTSMEGMVDEFLRHNAIKIDDRTRK